MMGWILALFKPPHKTEPFVLITNWIQYPTQTRTKVFIQVLKCKAQFSGYQQSTNQRN